jgi:inhibitor of KinA
MAIPASNATCYSVEPLGERAVVVRLGDAINEATFNRVQQFARQLEAAALPGVVEWVPTFTTVAVYYDPLRVEPSELMEAIGNLAATSTTREPGERRIVEIPVCYGGEYGEDLEAVTQHSGLSTGEVIAIHSGSDYLVYMLGFAPGFPYLGGMSPRIAMPRRTSPRLKIPAGSVGIAGEQTGIYPLETPGGWQLIGRTPLPLFRPNDNPPTLLQAGDVVRFRPISVEEYRSLCETSR